MRSDSTLASRARPVPIEHLPAPPPGQPHQVALTAPARKPAVGECVTELMWVKSVAEPGLASPLADDLGDATVG